MNLYLLQTALRAMLEPLFETLFAYPAWRQPGSNSGAGTNAPGKGLRVFASEKGKAENALSLCADPDDVRP